MTRARWRLGFSGRLVLAFSLVVAMTVAAALTAWISFTGLSDQMSGITERQMPLLREATRLAERSGAISATAPILITARDETFRAKVWADLQVLLADINDAAGAVGSGLGEPARTQRLRFLIARLAGNLHRLDGNVRTRFLLDARAGELLDTLRWLHADFLDEVEPMVSDARFNVESLLDRFSPEGDPPAARVLRSLRAESDTRDAVLNINAAGNLAIGLLSRAANAPSRDSLDDVRHFLGETAALLRRELKRLDGSSSSVSLNQLSQEIISYGEGQGRIFSTRAEQLANVAQGAEYLEENRKLVALLKRIVSEQIALITVGANDRTRIANQLIERGNLVIAAAVATAILVALVVGVFYVRRNLAARIQALNESMQAIAHGDLTAAIPRGGGDEIADMAVALEVFRDTALEVEEANAQTIIENARAGLITADRDGRIDFLNSSARELLGYPNDGGMPRRVVDFIADEDNAGSPILAERGGALPEPVYREAVATRRDGSRFPVELAVREFHQRTRAKMLITLIDISERKHAQTILEQRVRERTADLEASNRRLENEIQERGRAQAQLRQTQADLVQAAKLAALGQLSAGVAHELNQPLAAIRTYAYNAGVLIERERPAEAGAALQRITALTGRMGQIANHLKTFARRPADLTQPVDLRLVTENSLAFFETRIRRQGARLTVMFPERDLLVMAESIRLEQVMVNLLANALDAMETSDERLLTIAAKAAAGDVTVSVQDSGIGIENKNLERIFDPFFTTKDVGQGLGLGLSISYNIVKDFGGSMRAESRPGAGTTMIVSLEAA